MIDLTILACPECKKIFEPPVADKLTCNECRVKYTIKDNIPILLQNCAEPF